MKKNIVLIIALLVGLFALVFLFTCIPKNVDISYPAVQYYQDDPTTVKNITIHMKGKLYNPLFFDSKYVGICIIEGYDFTKEYQLIDITFNRNIENGLGVLSYTTIQTDGTPELRMIGRIWASENIDTLCIFGVAPTDVGTNGIAEQVIISAPAQTREEAKQITNQLRYGSTQ